MPSLTLDHEKLLTNLLQFSRMAGDTILEIYERDFDVQIKVDSSPLTEADLAAHHIIISALEELTPNIPVLSEESSDIIESLDWREWETYWLIDPLDGTKEFVKRNGEFTVNIALIHQHVAIIGVVHVPVSGKTYLGSNELGAFKLEAGDNELSDSLKIRVSNEKRAKPIILASRSHPSSQLQTYLDELGEHELKRSGSSLKFCLIAEGVADIYPRFGPTSEWDTAAAQAVVEAAGGKVMTLDETPLRYNTKDEILNPHFIVST